MFDNKLLPLVSSCKYEAMVLSDHSPVSMAVHFAGRVELRVPWRINTSLLSDQDFVNFIICQIDLFVCINKTPDVSASVVWESLKALIRGEIISYAAYQKRVRSDQLSMLTQRISQLDGVYATNPSPDVYKEHLSVLAKFDILMTQR